MLEIKIKGLEGNGLRLTLKGLKNKNKNKNQAAFSVLLMIIIKLNIQFW